MRGCSSGSNHSVWAVAVFWRVAAALWAVTANAGPWSAAWGSPPDREPATILTLTAPADLADAPDDRAHSTMRLGAGSQLRVRARLNGGWVEVDPPPGVVSWIRAEELEELGDGQARVLRDQTAIRTGRPGAILPGPIKLRLDRGILVRLVPSATLGDSTWSAIEPPSDDGRYVKLQTGATAREPVAANRAGDDRAISPGVTARTPRIGFRVASEPSRFPPDRFDESTPPPSSRDAGAVADADSVGLDTGLTSLDERYRAILKRPMYAWSLDEVESRYQAARETTDDPARRQAIERRLAAISRQKTLAESARLFQEALESSRRRQENLRDATRDAFRQVQSERYAAVGELYPSDKQRAGTRLHALFDPERGGVTAYLALPPGMRADRWISRTVGVEGSILFDSDLNARVIEVTDLEPLDER